MSEPTPQRRRRWLALALMPLTGLSGCLTHELWRGYAWPDAVVTEQRIDRHTRHSVGTLVESWPVLDNGLWWCDQPVATPSRWWLGPKVGPGAEVASALFADPDFCAAQSATIDAVRGNIGEEVLGDDAELELDLRLRDGAIGEVVPVTAVSPAAAHALAIVRRNAYLLAADPGDSLPVVYQRCVQRLAGVDLRAVVGGPDAVHAETWVFVNADGRPAFGAGTPTDPLPLAADDEDAPLADHLAALRQLSLLVRVRHGDHSTILRIRPDRLWLLSALHADGDHFTHRSNWHLQTVPLPLATPPAADAPRFPATLHLQEDRYQRSVDPVWFDGGLLSRVLATPVTLALDLVLGPGAGDFFNWISGKPPAPGEPKKQRY